MQKNSVQISRIIISIVFVLSAITKLISLEFFDGLVAELLLGDDWTSKGSALGYTQLLTRFLISAELVLGVAILQSKYVKSLVLPAIQLMLVLFTAHLVYVGLTSPKGFIEGNCGCFGDIIPMNNLESILKNIVAMALTTFIYFKFDGEKMEFSALVPPILVGVVCFGTLLLTVQNYETSTTPVDNTTSTYTNQAVATTPPNEKIDTISSATSNTEIATEESIKEVESTSDVNKNTNKVEETSTSPTSSQKTTSIVTSSNKLSPVFKEFTEFSGQKVNLFEGEKILCLFSLSCGHCQATYKDLVDIKRKVNIPQMYLINYGKKFDEAFFFQQAGETHPNIRMENYFKFDALLQGSDFPKVLVLKDGVVQQMWDLETIGDNSRLVLDPYFNVPAEVKETPKDEGGIDFNPNGFKLD